MGVPSVPSGAPVLTAAGRRELQQRRARALELLRQLQERMNAGERGADELAEQRRLRWQVEELDGVLARAADSATVDEDPTIVEVGDEVDVETDDDGVETYALVHPAEANAAARRISSASPLGRALLGARPGDRVTVDAPASTYTCTVRGRRRLL